MLKLIEKYVHKKILKERSCQNYFVLEYKKPFLSDVNIWMFLSIYSKQNILFDKYVSCFLFLRLYFPFLLFL